MLDFDHAEMSAILVEKWKFPENLINCIRNHHNLHEMEDPPLLERVIFVANQVAKSLDQDQDGHQLSMIEPMPDHIHQWLGMTLEEVPESISDLPTELVKAEAFLTL